MLFSPVGRSESVDHRAFTRTMRILESRHPVEDWARGMTPFEILISTILSQSTTVAAATHIARIARRWNLVRQSDYESIRAALERWTPPVKRKPWHLAIIAHGRTLCKARNPRCAECPVRRDCDWYQRKRPREQRTRRVPRRSDKGLRAP